MVITPTLTGIDDIEVLKNSKFNPLDGVKATDGSGNDITKNIKILKNNVNTDKVGDYEVIYSITNDKDIISKEQDALVSLKQKRQENR